MITKIYLLFSVVCCLLSFEGKAQLSNFITNTQAVLTTPSLVELTCVATSHPSIQSVVWYDASGNSFNSTSLTREEELDSNSNSAVVATLKVDRRACVNTVYTCAFDDGVALFSAELECPPIPEVMFESDIYNVSEGDGTLTVCLSLSNVTNGTVLTVTETDHTASRISDFTLPRVFSFTVTPELLTPPTNVTDNATPDREAGSVNGQLCFDIPITQDSVFEHTTESFDLRLTVQDVLAPSSRTRIYIQDDDELVIGFDMAEYTFQEGDEGCSVTVRVCLQVKEVILGLPLLVVPVWREGTALEGADYYAPQCSFSIPAGGYMDCMDLTIVNDLTVELTESLSVAVGEVVIDGVRVSLGNRVRTDVGEALILITDNDVFEVLFDEPVYTVSEPGMGESHTALRVCLTQPEGGAQSADMGEQGDTMTVDLIITSHDGTATGGIDYSSMNSTLSVRLPLSESVCVCVLIHHDRVVEATETFSLQLTASHPLVNTGTDTARVLLKDNSHSILSVGFERAEYRVREEDGSVEVCVTLTGQYQRTVYVLLSSEPHTATENMDFVRIDNHLLSFPADESSPPLTDGRACLNVTVLSDSLLEEDEEFILNLQSADPAIQLLDTSTTTVVILNNQGSLPILTFTNNTPSVTGNEVRAMFTVTQSQELISITCSLSGPGRTPTTTKNCSSGHVTFTDLPLRRQKFILSVSARLHSRPHTLTLTTLELRLDHSLCWLHPINEGVMVGGNSVTFQWQGTGPAQQDRVALYQCRRDREQFGRPCTSPYVWTSPSPGNHVLQVTPILNKGCKRQITRAFEFFYIA